MLPRTLLTACLVALVGCAQDPPPETNNNNDDGWESGWGSDGSDWPSQPDFGKVDSNGLVWRYANVTTYESYPDPGSEECVVYSGCEYAGHFAGLPGQQSYEWVRSTNIAAVLAQHFDQYNGKTLRIRNEWGGELDVTVYDMCSDSDCGGCCTRNASETGFLIDLEIHTAERFGTTHGVIEWACLNC